MDYFTMAIEAISIYLYSRNHNRECSYATY